MIRIFIDGVEARLDAGRPFSISLDVAELTSEQQQDSSEQISLPITRTNRAVVGDTDTVRSREKFNDTVHTARVERDGCVILSGEISLESVERGADGRGWYNMVVQRRRPGWIVQAAERMFGVVDVAFDQVMGSQTIRQSWTWNDPVRFLPVQREALLVRNASASVVSPAKVLTGEDYHPFLHVGTVLRSIVEGAGYDLRSDFVSSPLFDSLYMSGRYSEQDTSVLKDRLGFRAGRFEDKTAVADHYGKVKADPYTTLSSLGNLVETADPAEVRNGVKAEGVYNNGGAFRMVGSRVAFVPQSEVQVGFEFYLNYRTPYRIFSRGELSGFNSVTLCDGVPQTFVLVNNFADRRKDFTGGKNYMVMVFNHAAGTSYQLRYDKVINPNADIGNLSPSDVQNVTIATFSARTFSVTIPSGYPVTNMSLWAKASVGASYTLYTADWALYEGWVGETGTTEVEITLTSGIEKVTPSAPKYFDTIYFAGGEEGDVLTLCKQTSIRPVFMANQAAVGSRVRFADVAAHQVRQIDFINALKHMFNLRFYTDEESGQVFIEPYEGFFSNDVHIDLCSRSDRSAGVVIREPGAEMSRQTVFCYRSGDDAQTRYDAQNFTKTGRWSAVIESRLARQSTQTLENPLFTPSLSLKGGYPDAQDAFFLQVGERSDYYSERSDSLNFPAKIVRYMGMVDLPAGQVWGWPAYTGQYPLAAFHFHGTGNSYQGTAVNPLSSYSADKQVLVQNGFSLCFEDRDGVAGLHRFYDGQFAGIGSSRRVTLALRLGPVDIEAMVCPAGIDMRGVFIVEIEGEQVACRLESIGPYNPFDNSSTLCTFMTI